MALPAFAGKDILWVSSSTDGGNNRQLTLTNPIVGAKAVSVNVTWSIIADPNSPHTLYPKSSVGFNTQTSNGTSVGTISVSPTTCSFASNSATCSSTVSFTTPNVTENGIQVKINPTNTGSGNSALLPKDLFINFNVIQQVAKKDTVLTIPDPQCFAYKTGNVDVTGTLTELVSGNPISGRTVNFSVDSSPIGTSNQTDANGEAVLSYNVNGLAVGDHNLYGEFLGDLGYNGSNDSATLGISYNFVGFQQPINADGTSIFGGRIIPVKIKLTDANMQPVTDATPTVWFTQVSPSTAVGTDLEAATSVSAADTGNTMRYDASADQYIYNWDASNLANGTWYVIVELGDSAACSKGPYSAIITVNKKKTK